MATPVALQFRVKLPGGQQSMRLVSLDAGHFQQLRIKKRRATANWHHNQVSKRAFSQTAADVLSPRSITSSFGTSAIQPASVGVHTVAETICPPSTSHLLPMGSSISSSIQGTSSCEDTRNIVTGGGITVPELCHPTHPATGSVLTLNIERAGHIRSLDNTGTDVLASAITSDTSRLAVSSEIQPPANGAPSCFDNSEAQRPDPGTRRQSLASVANQSQDDANSTACSQLDCEDYRIVDFERQNSGTCATSSDAAAIAKLKSHTSATSSVGELVQHLSTAVAQPSIAEPPVTQPGQEVHSAQTQLRQGDKVCQLCGSRTRQNRRKSIRSKSRIVLQATDVENDPTVRRSSYGRLIIPPLEHWRREKAIRRCGAIVATIRNVALTSPSDSSWSPLPARRNASQARMRRVSDSPLASEVDSHIWSPKRDEQLLHLRRESELSWAQISIGYFDRLPVNLLKERFDTLMECPALTSIERM